MIWGLIIGFAVGLATGAGLVLIVRRPAAAAPEPVASTPSVTPEPALEDPVPGPGPVDDEVKRAIDASAGLLDELETRYRDRPRPAGDDDETQPAPRRKRPRR